MKVYVYFPSLPFFVFFILENDKKEKPLDTFWCILSTIMDGVRFFVEYVKESRRL